MARGAYLLTGALFGLACGTNVDLGGGLDGSVKDASSCPAFASPATPSTCQACTVGKGTCQANGCFNGYLCDFSIRYCKAPGTPCSFAGKFDAGHD